MLFLFLTPDSTIWKTNSRTVYLLMFALLPMTSFHVFSIIVYNVKGNWISATTQKTTHEKNSCKGENIYALFLLLQSVFHCYSHAATCRYVHVHYDYRVNFNFFDISLHWNESVFHSNFYLPVEKNWKEKIKSTENHRLVNSFRSVNAIWSCFF